MRNALAILLVFAFASIPMHFAVAQESDGNSFGLTLNPQNPKPSEEVTATIKSISVDLTRADIEWLINDARVAKGVGKTVFSFKAGSAGTAVRLAVSALLQDGRIFTKEITIVPEDVVLVWQSASYTPPFYKGKALYPIEGEISFVALPFFVFEGKRVPSGELFYEWTKDGKILPSASGLGKDTLTFRGRLPLRGTNIKVLVATADKQVTAEALSSADPTYVKILLYENHPRYGIRFNKAVGANISLGEDDVKLLALPFFFETPGRDSGIPLFTWSMNYQPISGEQGSTVVFKNQNGGGQSLISVKAENPERSFQAAEIRTMASWSAAKRAPAGTSSGEGAVQD